MWMALHTGDEDPISNVGRGPDILTSTVCDILASIEPVQSSESEQPPRPIYLPPFEVLSRVDCSEWENFAYLFGIIDLPDSALRRLEALPKRCDHTEQARLDSAYLFLDRVFLPAIKVGEVINLMWLVDALIEFKDAFHEEYPEDYPLDVSLIHALEEVLFLQTVKSKANVMVSGERTEVDHLVFKANSILSHFLEEYPDLYLL